MHASRLPGNRPCRALTRFYLVAVVVMAGCGGGSPEERQALAKIQDLGGRVNVKRGGYEVDLSGTAVEANDLAQLKHIRNLKNVVLQGTRINDEGLAHLRGIATLEMIDLRRTGVSKEGVESLKQALPNAQIDH